MTEKQLSQWQRGIATVLCAAPAVLMLGATACRATSEEVAVGGAQRKPTPANAPIGALGRIEPGDGIIVLGARSLSGQPSIVGNLLVKEGDMVTAQQPIAELESRAQLEAAERQAAAHVAVARQRLAQVEAGAKPADLAVQQAEISRLEVELAAANRDHTRYASLGDNVTAAELDTMKTRIDSTTHALTAARQRLVSLSDVRSVDTSLARADVDEAERNVARLRAEKDASLIKSPIDGRIVKVRAHAGEQVQDGLVEIAPLTPMYAVAEVSELDIARAKVGQKATISGDGLAAPVKGVVERVSPKVLQNEMRPLDPASYSDGRIVDVWVKVDDPTAVANLIHMRVDVTIEP